jgi:ribose transport system ATP-binding protein
MNTQESPQGAEKLSRDVNPILLAMKHISKSFLGVKVLDDVDFFLRKGEVVAFLGANGAGKSTLMKILAGVYHADEGQIFLHGKLVSFNKPIQAYRAGISVVHQESSLIPTLTIIENLFLGREYQSGPGVMNDRRMLAEYEELCGRFDLDIPASTKVRDLSPAHKKMAEIMKAVSRNSSIIIMDEPTDALSSQETAILFKTVGDLRRQGMSIVFITHFLDEVKSIADSATVIRDGRIVAERVSPQLPIKGIVALMLGKEIAERKPFVKTQAGKEELVVRNLGRRKEFSGVSFELRTGEVLGIAGVVGSGKTELARTLSGASISHAGTMSIEGRQIRLNSPFDGVRHGIGMAPEDRKTQGLILDQDIQSNISLSSLRSVARHGCISSRKENERTVKVASQLSIKYAELKQRVKFLSGGNQQKCVLARWLLASPKVLILDEPTRGIDVATKEQIYAIVRDLAAKGKSIIYLTGDPAEVLVVSDRVMVMQKGKIKRVYSTSPTEEMLMKDMIEVNNEQ